VTYERADILQYLTNSLHAVAVETGQVETDTPEGYSDSIDNALRQLGVPETSLDAPAIADTQIIASQLWAEYFALQRYLRSLAMYVDISIDAPLTLKKRSQAFRQVEALIRANANAMEEMGVGSRGMRYVAIRTAWQWHGVPPIDEYAGTL